MEGIQALTAPAQAAPPPAANPSAALEQGLLSFLEGLKPADIKAMAEVQAELVALDPEDLAGIADLFIFLEANPDQYAATVADMVADGTIDSGDLPSEYNENFVKLMSALVQSAMPQQAAQGFADGGLASLGRGGDTMLAHITPGEAHLLRSRGGSGTINPYTGHPEFFLKKAFKKVKGIVKKATKLFKKAAAVVLPIALSFTPLGPILGSALGSAIATVLNGGDLKDAFRSGLKGAAAGAAFSGARGMMQGKGFLQGVKAGLPASMQGAAAAPAPAGNAADATKAAGISPDPSATVNPPFADPSAATSINTQFSPAPAAANTAQNFSPVAQPVQAPNLTPMQQQLSNWTANSPRSIPTVNADSLTGIQRLREGVSDFGGKAKEYGTKVKNFLDPSHVSEAQQAKINKAGLDAYNDAIAQGAPEWMAQQVGKQAVQAAQPGTLSKYGPLLGAGLGISGLAGGFKQPEVDTNPLGFGDPIDPAQFNIYPGGLPPLYQGQMPQANYTQVPGYAYGGQAQRQIGHIQGPGTSRSDSIPARLSDGEFVFTAKAVKGAGGGDMQKGVQAMYDMMNSFERRG